MKKTTTFALAGVIALGAGLAFAGGHGGNPAVTARKAHMNLYQHNLNIIGNMAKGEMEYNAETAQAVADNLVELTSLSQIGYWTPGTSRDDLGEMTRALPGLWGEGSKAREIGGQVRDAAVELAAVASMDAESLGPAIGKLGQACTACHKEYRFSAN